MKIGLVIPNTPGYSETFFTSKIKGLQAQGFDVCLFCQHNKDGFNLCPVQFAPKVFSNPVLQGWYFIKEFLLLLPYLSRVIRYVKLERKEGTGLFQLLKKTYLNAHLLKAKLDWLHFGFATQALGSETVANAIGAKMAVSFRGFDVNVYPVKNPGCYNRLWKYVDKVHSISRYLLKKAKGMGLSPETPSTIITPAVQMASLPKPQTVDFNNTLKFVTIARLSWIKGLDIAIAAMKVLKEEGIQFKYHIIGEGDKSHTERYKFMVYELGLQKEVLFCGKQSHKETLQNLNSAHVYVQPSLNEGFCNAVLEAQALGRLTIASNAGGLPENIVDGKTGWLFETHSSKSLAETIKKVVALPPEQQAIIAQNAQQRVQKEFTIEKQQKEFLDFYEL